MPLDELTVAEKPGVYFAHIMAQPNVPAYVKTALPRLYQEKTMPHNFEPYMKIGEPLRQHLEQLSVCRDAACPVPNSHPFYPTPDAPPFYFGKQPCMPVVPTRLKMGGVMVLGIYPNCRRATVATADGNRQMWVPIEDADEPFEYSRYFDSYGVRDLRAGTILQRAYWAQLGLDRERDMYITNIVKCFLFEPDDVQTVHTLGWTSPPVSATRARYFEAAQVCVRLHLAKEIELCQPKLVIAVGGEGCRVIHDRLNPADTSAGKIFSQLRGKLLRAGVDEGPNDSRSPLFRSVNVLHLYHPSGLSLGNLNRHLTDMRHGREALVGLGLAPSSLLDYATPQSDIDEIKTLIREQN